MDSKAQSNTYLAIAALTFVVVLNPHLKVFFTLIFRENGSRGGREREREINWFPPAGAQMEAG